MVLQSLPACGFRTNKREATKSMTKHDVSLNPPRSRDGILIRTKSIETLGDVNEQLLSGAGKKLEQLLNNNIDNQQSAINEPNKQEIMSKDNVGLLHYSNHNEGYLETADENKENNQFDKKAETFFEKYMLR